MKTNPRGTQIALIRPERGVFRVFGDATVNRKTQQGVMFEELFDKPVVVEFTRPGQSSDGGVILLKAADEKLGLTRRLAKGIRDPRQPGKIIHGLVDILCERIFGIGCGYPDGNDAARLSADPMMRLVCHGASKTARGLASQPTVSRLENGMSRTNLLRMAHALTDVAIDAARLRRRGRPVRRITIDLDPTEDPTYGDQQLTFFNGYYESWCYLPMVTTFTLDDESEQTPVAPVLRPGNATGSQGAIGILKRLLSKLRQAFPAARIVVRMDGAFATPEVLAWLEAQKLLYLVNMAKNSVLKRLAEPLMQEVRRQSGASGRTERAYGETMYKADTWDHPRRVVMKAEVTVLRGLDPRDNPRFVITNLKGSPTKVYRTYAERGDMENRIKELHDGLRFDLTSCTAFQANQFRNLLTVSAYLLLQQVRRCAAGTTCSGAQVWTLRDRLLKIGVTVRESARRILLEGPLAFPWFSTWRQIAVRLGASP